MRIIEQFGKQYVLVATATECSKMLDAGLKIENVADYGNRAPRSKPNKTKADNLRKRPKMKR